jgi:hypothetical protein
MLHEASKDVISLLCINNELSYEVRAAAPFPVAVPQTDQNCLLYGCSMLWCTRVLGR